eukprot:CAMPEP_0170225364 /NCGR_PEP_ID=MMETSP0116_2-20130129/12391_1 /TAXON_ID=400756 /ORGANISM="Durinskia baltica, Strain CSIRO CS-38" /LENGTH=772 /DNA_ID=CAMNT_0010476085 /DNA_START=89 /DNA_END=2404 /DNA_ORIENTATION=-
MAALRRLAGLAALVASSTVLFTSAAASEEPPQVYLVAKPFVKPWNRQDGPALTGRFEIVTSKSSGAYPGVHTVQHLRWDLGGVPDACKRKHDDDSGACRIYLAKRKKGNPCQEWYDWERPVPLYNFSHINPDPWQRTKYVANTNVGTWQPSFERKRASAGIWRELSAAEAPRRDGLLSTLRCILGWSNSRIDSRGSAGDVEVEAGLRTRGSLNVTTGVNWEVVKESSVVLHDAAGELIGCAEFDEVSGCYPEAEWRKQGVFDFGMAFESCGTNIYCTKGHPDCRHACTLDEDCEHYPMRVCDGIDHLCRHKGLFEGGSYAVFIDVAAGLMFAFTSGLSISVGIGGGGLFVPLLSLLLCFNLREATALSQACLAGGSSTALLYNLRTRHPSGRKPMIDYDLVLVMSPILLVGSVIGSLLHMMMPSWAILAVLDLVLLYSCGKTFQKAAATRRKEAEVAGSQVSMERALRPAGAPQSYEQFGDAASEGPQGAGDARDMSVEMMRRRAGGATGSDSQGIAGKTRTWPQFPAVDILLLLVVWAVATASIFVRGSRKQRGVVEFASVEYWAIIGGTALLLVAVAAIGACRAAGRPLLGVGSGLLASRDLVFTAGASAKIVVASVVAGAVAALCGIGGGLIMGPVLLGLGALPQVQSASTGTALFVMSTTLALTYIVQGEVIPSYAVYFAIATGTGAICGRPILSWLIRKSMRPSVMVFLLAFIILAAVLVMSVTSVMQVMDDIMRGQEVGFKAWPAETSGAISLAGRAGAIRGARTG